MSKDGDASYWRDEAYEALRAAEVLLENLRYVESGFFCHLAAEKMLKALVAQRTHRTPPRIHALWRLAEIAGVEDDFTAKQVDTIADLSVFQVEGRYPSDRNALLDANPPERFNNLYNRTKEALSCLDSLLK
ncbi:MAG TPA: HEPN domain-containing protein [Bacillota bacterium]|nr:HEPN domain-containing protein [Bacillota bacterium]HPU74782.1 HEPN domain-containing protein [Bacillota bacterium]